MLVHVIINKVPKTGPMKYGDALEQYITYETEQELSEEMAKMAAVFVQGPPDKEEVI